MKTTYSFLTKSFAVLTVLALTSFAFNHSAFAQANYKSGDKQTVMTLYGTSTLHNWEMKARTFNCDAQFVVTNNELTGLQALSLTLPVRNLKSEKESMNDNAYEALKEDKYKNIIFKMTSAKVANNQITALGNLTIAGVTKPVTLTAATKVNADGSVSCSGQVALKLSDFGIERPSFVFGTMKVGDALTLNYALVFSKQGGLTSN
jgi:polyisoprenoid-binding protein YceI